MTEKITFRLDSELGQELVKIIVALQNNGLDFDQSKVIRYVLRKGIEKLKLEGMIK